MGCAHSADIDSATKHREGVHDVYDPRFEIAQSEPALSRRASEQSTTSGSAPAHVPPTHAQAADGRASSYVDFDVESCGSNADSDDGEGDTAWTRGELLRSADATATTVSAGAAATLPGAAEDADGGEAAHLAGSDLSVFALASTLSALSPGADEGNLSHTTSSVGTGRSALRAKLVSFSEPVEHEMHQSSEEPLRLVGLPATADGGLPVASAIRNAGSAAAVGFDAETAAASPGRSSCVSFCEPMEQMQASSERPLRLELPVAFDSDAGSPDFQRDPCDSSDDGYASSPPRAVVVTFAKPIERRRSGSHRLSDNPLAPPPSTRRVDARAVAARVARAIAVAQNPPL